MNEQSESNEQQSQLEQPSQLGSELPSKPDRKAIRILLITLGSIAIVGLAFYGTWLLLAANTPHTTQKHQNQAKTRSINTSAPHSANFEQAYARVSSKYNIAAFSEKTKLLTAYDDLSDGFSITGSPLHDDTMVLHALGIAAMYTQDTGQRDRYRSELYLLLAGHLASLPSGITDNTFEIPDDQKSINVLKKFQDTDLTNRVEQSSALQQVLTATVIQLKLGSKNKLSPYKIIAFGFDNTDAKFDELIKEHSLYGARPKMWAENLNGTVYIMMFKSYANQVVNGEHTSLPHEFIHAQSAFVRGETGRMIEERRAELFSGDTSAYYDAKQLVIYLNVFSGIDIYLLLQANPTDSAKLYAKLYKDLGVKGTNAIVFSWPNIYQNSGSQALDKIYSLNNQDVALQEALTLGKKDGGALEKRVSQRYQKLLAVFKSNDKVVSDLSGNLDQVYRMPTAANYMKDYAKHQ